MKETFTKEDMMEFRNFRPSWSNAKNELEQFLQSKEKQYPWEQIEAIKIPGNDHWEVTKLPNGTYNSWSYLHTAEQLNKGIWSIKRVKNSKGEVFSLGDTTNQGVILAFDKPGNELCSDFRAKINSSSCGWRWLNDLNKVVEKPILLTTEDGFQCRNTEEDLYDISIENWNYLGTTPVKYIINMPSYKEGKRKFFLSESAAKAYIKENKPKFSEKEILEAIKYGENKSNNSSIWWIKQKLGI